MGSIPVRVTSAKHTRRSVLFFALVARTKNLAQRGVAFHITLYSTVPRYGFASPPPDRRPLARRRGGVRYCPQGKIPVNLSHTEHRKVFGTFLFFGVMVTRTLIEHDTCPALGNHFAACFGAVSRLPQMHWFCGLPQKGSESE